MTDLLLATVTSTTGGIYITLDGSATQQPKIYKRISGTAPSLNDRVLLAKVSGTYVIIGKLV